jgi:hypothetical protein
MSNGTFPHALYSLPHGHLRATIDLATSDETLGDYLIICNHNFTAEVWHRSEFPSRIRVEHAVTPAQYAQSLLNGSYRESDADHAANLAQNYWLTVEVHEDTTVLIRCEHSGEWCDWEQIVIAGPAIWIEESDEVDSEGHPYHWVHYELKKQPEHSF